MFTHDLRAFLVPMAVYFSKILKIHLKKPQNCPLCKSHSKVPRQHKKTKKTLRGFFGRLRRRRLSATDDFVVETDNSHSVRTTLVLYGYGSRSSMRNRIVCEREEACEGRSENYGDLPRQCR